MKKRFTKPFTHIQNTLKLPFLLKIKSKKSTALIIYIFVAAIESNMTFLAGIGIIASVISAFYYLRIVKIIYFDDNNKFAWKDVFDEHEKWQDDKVVNKRISREISYDPDLWVLEIETETYFNPFERIL